MSKYYLIKSYTQIYGIEKANDVIELTEEELLVASRQLINDEALDTMKKKVRKILE